jgi:hypothetical protein
MREPALRGQTGNLIRRESDSLLYSQRDDECKLIAAFGLGGNIGVGTQKKSNKGIIEER